MKRIFSVAAAAAAILVAQPAVAGISAEANGARAEGRWGGELGLGHSLGGGGFAVRPIIGAFLYEGDQDRYYMDDNGGNPRCRDSTNGQYAKTSYCNNLAVSAYGKIEATYTIPLGPEIGAGVRLSQEQTSPYGTIAIPLAPSIKLKGNAGDGYYAVGIRAGF